MVCASSSTEEQILRFFAENGNDGAPRGAEITYGAEAEMTLLGRK
jgi:hypothetical protein